MGFLNTGQSDIESLEMDGEAMMIDPDLVLAALAG